MSEPLTHFSRRNRRLEQLGLIFILAAVLLYGRFAEDPFRGLSAKARGDELDTSSQPPDEAKGAPHKPKEGACDEACGRIVGCGLLDDADMCRPWCVDEWSGEIMECVMKSPCDRIETGCFVESDEELCGRVCARAATCGWKGGGENCSDRCLKQWGREDRACLLSTPCGEGLSDCVAPDSQLPCGQVCDKLVRCGFTESAENAGCLRSCEEEMDYSYRDCILKNECSVLDAECSGARLPDNLCAQACDIMADCEMAEFKDCLSVCGDEWGAETPLCLIGSENCGAAMDCLRTPGMMCAQLCVHFIECGQLTDIEYDACRGSCPYEFSDVERDCLMLADCASIPDCIAAPTAEEGPSPPCAEACAKMRGCGLIQPLAALDCEQNCIDNWTMQRGECVLNAPCSSVAMQCLSEAPSAP